MKKFYILLFTIFCLIGCASKPEPDLVASAIYTVETENIAKTIQELNTFNNSAVKILAIDIDSVKVIYPEIPMKADMYTTWTVLKKHYDFNQVTTVQHREVIPVIISVTDIRPVEGHPEYIKWYADWQHVKYFVL